MNVTFTNCLISYSTVSEVKDDVKNKKANSGLIYRSVFTCIAMLSLNSLVLNRGTDVHIMVL